MLKTLRKSSVFGAFTLLGIAGLFAKELTLHSVRPGYSKGSKTDVISLYVFFETPVVIPAAAVNFHCGDQKTSNPWHIVLYDTTGKPQILDGNIAKACAIQDTFASDGLVTLSLARAVSDYSRIEVTYSGGNAPSATLKKGVKNTTPIFQATHSRDGADVYISGAVTPAVGAGPSYAIDSSLKYTLRQWGENALLSSGSVKTDDRPTADPNSFTWSVGYKRTGHRHFTAQWNFAGMELDKRANAMNYVSAPKLLVTADHLFKSRRGSGENTYLVPRVLVGIDVVLGLEFGDNLKNQYSIANRAPNQGYGAFLRGVPSATAYLAIPHALWLKSINWTTAYTARIPATDEIFLETRLGTKSPVPMLTSNARHYLLDDLQFMFTDFAGFEIKHQYGSLPPTFTFVNHKVSIGLVVQFKQGRVHD